MSWSVATDKAGVSKANIDSLGDRPDLSAHDRDCLRFGLNAARSLAELVGRSQDYVVVSVSGHSNDDHSPTENISVSVSSILAPPAAEKVPLPDADLIAAQDAEDQRQQHIKDALERGAYLDDDGNLVEPEVEEEPPGDDDDNPQSVEKPEDDDGEKKSRIFGGKGKH